MNAEAAGPSSGIPRDSEVDSDSMSKSKAGSARKVRVSGKHSRGGCGTCKIRRVKCDETKPICIRCQKFGITCDGYQRQAPPPATQPTLPIPIEVRPVVPSPFHILPSMLLHNSEKEEQYFKRFRDSTSLKLDLFFENDALRSVLLKSCNKDSIRHGVIALAALDQFMDGYQSFPLDSNVTTTNEHHKSAVQQYSRAVTIMNRDIAGGRQDLRTTLLTCLLISIFETSQGNSTLADSQIKNGIELLRTWHIGHSNSKHHPFGFSSPEPSHVDDILEQIYGRLDVQRLRFNESKCLEDDLLPHNSDEDILDKIPNEFRTVHDARLHLDLIFRRVKRWVRTIAVTFGELTEDSKAVNSPILLEWFVIPTSKLGVRDGLVDVSNFDQLQRKQERHLHHCRLWIKAFEALLYRNRHLAETTGCAILKIDSEAIMLMLRTSLCTDLMIFDTFRKDMNDIVSLAEDFVDKLQRGLRVKTVRVSLDFGPFTSIYFIALNCRDSSIRKRAINLLHTMQHQAAMMRSKTAAAVATCIQQIEDLHRDAIGMVPTWARVRSAGVEYDQRHHTLSLVYRQGEVTDCEIVVKEKKIFIPS